jgi:cellulose biosynthesis protein BcsQ
MRINASPRKRAQLAANAPMRHTGSMRILVLHTPKGGSGKSTMARELAVAASATMQVALADLDPQGTTTGWYQRREAKAPALVNLDPTKSWTHLADAGVEFIAQGAGRGVAEK